MKCKTVAAVVLLLLINIFVAAQYRPTAVYEQLLAIEGSPVTSAEKLSKALAFKINFDNQHYPHDSVYARLLHKIAFWLTDANEQYDKAIPLTKAAIRINVSGAANSCPTFAVNSYNNLAYFYKTLNNYPEALRFFDSAAELAKKYPAKYQTYIECYSQICFIHHTQGNYEEEVAVANAALRNTNALLLPTHTAYFHSQTAIALIKLKKFTQASVHLTEAIKINQQLNEPSAIAGCYKIAGELATGQGDIQKACNYYVQALAVSNRCTDMCKKASLLVDAGSFYLDIPEYIPKAKECFNTVIALKTNGSCDKENVASAYNNLGYNAVKEYRIADALKWYQKSINLQTGEENNSIFQNQPFQKLQLLPGKDLIYLALGNKAESLMMYYKISHQQAYLQAAMSTYRLADSLITDMRNGQTGNETKLYWRNISRNFYQQAIETSYLSNDPATAFYFMEKSRAVLLNDRLNELGATTTLPPAEAYQEQNLQLKKTKKEARLSAMAETDTVYAGMKDEVWQAQQELQHFIQSLEQKYPAYYQYKYADEVATMPQLQQHLKSTGRQMIQYFTGDTVLYVLYANGTQVKLYRSAIKNLDSTIAAFLESCANKNAQNNNYQRFQQTSNLLYRQLLQPLNLTPGSLIISPDNAIFPFDALCTDVATNRMLVQDFAVSYAYSARYLLKSLPVPAAAKGQFLGLAPVQFPDAMQLSSLPSSAPALQQLKVYFPGALLLSNEQATRRSMLHNLSDYTIVNLYSHARSGNDSLEPQLFLADSAIRLSELQVLGNTRPATQLIVLSACQTNTGRLAAGEGVYTIARGFALAGIPAAVATLWKADEQATYYITEEFYRNLSGGMDKDAALQKAKLKWMEEMGLEKQLPYYWANLTLMGNADKLVKQRNYWWFITGGLILLTGVAAWFRYKKRGHKSAASH